VFCVPVVDVKVYYRIMKNLFIFTDVNRGIHNNRNFCISPDCNALSLQFGLFFLRLLWRLEKYTNHSGPTRILRT